jgi:hypothetical protein
MEQRAISTVRLAEKLMDAQFCRRQQTINSLPYGNRIKRPGYRSSGDSLDMSFIQDG